MSAYLDKLIDPHRLKVYGATLVGLYLVLTLAWWAVSADGLDLMGKPLGYDFITFYAGARLALAGQALDVFSVPRILAAEQAAVPANWMIFLWHYPPTYHLLVTPLGWLPYLQAYAVFVLATGGLYLALMRRIVDHRLTLIVALAFPAAFLNAFHGQNGFLNAALLGFGLLALERRPVLAGVLLGFLASKPHLGVLLPFALAAGGHGRAFVAAALTVTGLCAMATVAFGFDYWHAFFANLSLTRGVLEQGTLPWAKMPTVFALSSLLGAPARLAYLLQATVAVSVAAATVWAWSRPGSFDLKAALLVCATTLLSPYLFDYDLVLLAIPVALLVRHGVQMGEPSRNAALLTGISLLPLGGTALSAALHLQVMALSTLALFGLCWLRLAADRAALGEAASLQVATA